VNHWLYSSIPADNLVDQYAFKPTGSTTAALAYFTRYVTKMLEHNNYVRCLMIDFSKAFDTVDRVILLSKLVQLKLPGFVINWICSFSSGRGQQCKVNGALSDNASIGLSIVQGSGIGPTVYLFLKSDLLAISELNDIFKYADDSITLLVPEHTDVDLNIEYNHIKQWAATNGLIINSNKTKKVIFRQPRVSCFHLPAAIDNTEQVDCCKL